jgi:hypothetical protein
VKGASRPTASQREVAGRQSSPYTGKPSARPACKPGIFRRQGELATIPATPLDSRSSKILRRLSMRFLRHGGIYLVRWGFQKQNQKQNQTLRRDQTASRWSAPRPGKRTRREDRAPSHRPQMSSDRLFLDRVARQHCPSLLHRHTQINMHSADRQGDGDISTLPERGHFYFALTHTPPPP